MPSLQTWSIGDLILLPDGRTGKAIGIHNDEILTVETQSGAISLSKGIPSLWYLWSEDDERALEEAIMAIAPLIVEDP